MKLKRQQYKRLNREVIHNWARSEALRGGVGAYGICRALVGSSPSPCLPAGFVWEQYE